MTSINLFQTHVLHHRTNIASNTLSHLLMFPLHLTPIFSLLLTFHSVGSDKSFAAGADIKEMASRTYVESYMSNMFRDFIDVAKIRKPTIAAVSGFALGGGCELAMMCDIIIASETAKFGQPEIALGVIPGALRRHPSLS
jgi:1,4-dihydroxy-2-naphthoyl-CoA synthase